MLWYGLLMVLITNIQPAAERLSAAWITVHVTKRSLGLWVLFFSLSLWPPSFPPLVVLSPVAPWEREGWNDTQWLAVAQGPGFWPWLAGSVWQLVSPLPSLWPAASTVVVVGLIGASLWSLTLGLTLNCSLLPTWLVVRKWYRVRGCNQEHTHTQKLNCPVEWTHGAARERQNPKKKQTLHW